MKVIGAALIVLLAQGAAAQQTGSIDGVVVRAGSLEPIGKAVVELRQETSPLPALGGVMALVQSATAGSDGRFHFQNVAPGRYQLLGVRSGYARGPLTIVIAAGQTTSNLQIAMTPAAAFAGRVSGAAGEPLGNITMRALRASYRSGRRTLTPVQTTRTDDLGEYRFFWLTPGRYFVSATHPAALTGPEAMASMSGGSLSMSMGVRATRSTGDPAQFEREVDSGQDQYVTMFYPGTPDQQSAGAVDLGPGADVAGVDIHLTPATPRRVRGFVIDGVTGAVAEYPRVVVDDGQSSPVRLGLREADDTEPAINETTHAFSVLVTPGPHLLTGTSGTSVGYLPVDVGDRDLDNVQIPTSPEFNIQGRIVSDGADQGILGALQISLVRDLPVLLRPGSYSQPTEKGTFVVSATAGAYRVNIIPVLNLAGLPQREGVPRALTTAYVKSITMGNTDVLNGGLRVEGPSPNTLDIVIGTRPGTLSGLVGNAQQQAAGSATVVLVPDVRSRSDLYKAAATDAAGRFQFQQVPPGSYRVFAWEDVSDGAWFDPDFLRAFENRGAAVQIAEGSEANVGVLVIPAQ